MKEIARYLDDLIETGTVKNDSDTARKMGLSRATVSKWRSGDRTPDDDEAVKLAVLLNRDPGELLAECGAARAKTPETRRAWERIAAKMASSSINACVLLMLFAQIHDAKAYSGSFMTFKTQEFSEVEGESL